MGMERLGKVSHPLIGSMVKVALVTWDGSRQRQDRRELLFPTDQRRITMHPKHPTGFDPETGTPAASVAPSCSFYADLCRYGQFRWPERGDAR